MRRTRIVLPAVLAVLVLVVAGCSPEEPDITAEDQLPESEVTDEPTDGEDGGTGDEPAGRVEFVAVDIDYSSAPDTVPAGSVTFELVNDGGILHDVTIEELGDETVVEAEGGQSATGEVELEPGEYTYYCSVPGHREAGMEGQFAVE